jgi:zinc protease
LEAVMRLEADRFENNRWVDDEFRREIEVVKEERRQRIEESPRARMFEAFSAMSFQAHPYRRPVIGWMSDIEAMKPQDVRDFHQRWYVPGNAAVVIAGDVDVAKVRALAETVYGRIPARPLPQRKASVEPAQEGMRRMEYLAAAEQSMVVMAWPMPRLTDPAVQDETTRDALALMVLAAVLDGYSGARLDRALVQGLEGARVADSASAGYGPLGRGPAQFSLSAVPAAGVSAADVENALRHVVERIAREGVDEATLQRVKTQWAAGEIYKLDSVFNQAQELGTYWINGLGNDSVKKLMSGLKAVSGEQVRSVAQRLFPPDRLNVAVLVPDPTRRSPSAPAGSRPALSRH